MRTSTRSASESSVLGQAGRGTTSSLTATAIPRPGRNCCSGAWPGPASSALGLVTTKLGDLEKADDLRRRIDEASKYVPLDQLCLSPQCGFSSTVHGNNIAVQAQRDKLRLVVEVAQEVWG